MDNRYYYEYEDAGEYCYPGTLVLINKLGLQDAAELHEVERKLTALNISHILDEPVKGVLDFRHLQSIHKAVFDDVYPWAGKIRTVNIAKGNQFCNTGYIETYARKIFDELKNEDYLVLNSTEQIALRLAYYLSEINILHPFREGNGRAQRVMIEYIAKVAGFDLDFSHISGEVMVRASAEAFNGEYATLTAIFERILQPLPEDEQADFVYKLTAKRGPVYLAWHKKHL